MGYEEISNNLSFMQFPLWGGVFGLPPLTSGQNDGTDYNIFNPEQTYTESPFSNENIFNMNSSMFQYNTPSFFPFMNVLLLQCLNLTNILNSSLLNTGADSNIFDTGDVFNTSNIFGTGNISDTGDIFGVGGNSNLNSQRYTPRIQTSADFDKMLNFVLDVEGGAKATKVKGDRGGLTKKGIIQATYDDYRRKKGLPKQSVANMTDTEMKDIYYNMFYKGAGADKIQDARLAFYVFDTAVNMGVKKAKALLKESGGDLKKFAQLRRKKYNDIVANNPSQKKFIKGWQNRVTKMENFANTQFA